jgi:hypothetical protein
MVLKNSTQDLNSNITGFVKFLALYSYLFFNNIC